MRTLLAAAVIVAGGLSASAAERPGTSGDYHARLASSDLRISPRAYGKGARVKLLSNPRRYNAGVSLPALTGNAFHAYQVVQAINEVAKKANIDKQVNDILRSDASNKDKIAQLTALVATTDLAQEASASVGLTLTDQDIAIAISDLPMGEKIAKIGKEGFDAIAQVNQDNADKTNSHDDKHGADSKHDGKHGDVSGEPETPQATVADAELIRNGEFTTGLENWETKGAFTTDRFGSIRASSLHSRDGVFAVAHTGWADESNLGYVEQNVTVPMARSANFSMLYNFVTSEYPYWVGSQYNDYYQVTITGPSGEKTMSMAEYLNSTYFTLVDDIPTQLDAWFGTAGQTGWKIMGQNALPLKQGIYKVRVEVRDVSDDIFDSAILVDRISLR